MMAREYRIRWAIVERCNGYTCRPARMCIAERRVTIFWIIRFWSPFRAAEWRETQRQAEMDIEMDIRLNALLPGAILWTGDDHKVS